MIGDIIRVGQRIGIELDSTPDGRTRLIDGDGNTFRATSGLDGELIANRTARTRALAERWVRLTNLTPGQRGPTHMAQLRAAQTGLTLVAREARTRARNRQASAGPTIPDVVGTITGVYGEANRRAASAGNAGTGNS